MNCQATSTPFRNLGSPEKTTVSTLDFGCAKIKRVLWKLEAVLSNATTAPWYRTRDCLGSQLLQQAVVETHELVVVVIFKHELAGPHFGLLTQEDLRTKMALKLG
jgi:hypothetical protein